MDEKKWKRKLPYRIYDYNYKVGESYYNPQTQYIEDRDLLRNKVVPPECASYAERFAAKPFYGGAYGLPYDNNRSALDQPLVRRRSVSGSRADRGRDYEPASTSSAGRLGRDRDRGRAPRDRRLSFNLDEADLDMPRRKFSLADDLDFKTPISKYVDSDFGFRSSLDRDSLTGERDPIGIPPAMKESIQGDIRKLEKQFEKASKIERGTGGPRAQQWSEVVFNEPDTPTRKTSVKRDNVSYRDPITGANVRKTSYQETSSSSSSKPPRAPPKPSRLLSIEDSMPSRPRRRHFSFSSGDDDNFDFKLSSRSIRGGGDDDIDRKFSSSKKMFDSRRAQESEELTNNINKMLGKMRKHSLTGGNESFSSSRFTRASSLDPEPRSMRSSIRSEKYSSYGVSK